MSARGQAVTWYYQAWDTVNAVGKTGDVANHTLRLVLDGGTPTAPTNTPAELDATNMPGWYELDLTAAETTAHTVLLAGKSSTSGVVLWAAPLTTEAAGGGGGSTGGTWTFSTTTTMADPGAGRLRFNSATVTTATEVALDNLTDDGVDMSNLLRSLSAGDSVYIQDRDNATNWARFTLDVIPLDEVGWWLLEVTLVESAGTAPGNNSPLEVMFRYATAAPPTVAEIADGILARKITGGADGERSVRYYLQGGTNKVEFTADGTGFTVYSHDDTTVLMPGTATRHAAGVGGLRSVTVLPPPSP